MTADLERALSAVVRLDADTRIRRGAMTLVDWTDYLRDLQADPSADPQLVAREVGTFAALRGHLEAGVDTDAAARAVLAGRQGGGAQ